jgi:TolB-like protein
MTANGRVLAAGGCLAVALLVVWTALNPNVLDRAYPMPQPTTVDTGSAGSDGSVLWLLSVGVSQYSNPELNLQFADADARAMADTIQSAARNGPYREVRTLVLTNGEATRESILGGLSRFLGQAGADDVAILFAAGHGIRDLTSGSYYFLPSPATSDNLLTEGLRMSDFDEMLRVVRRNVHAVVVMLDTCHAGALGIPSSRLVSADEMARQMTGGEGFFLLAATKPGEESKEQSALGHGAFTYAVLEGLRGGADTDSDGSLMVSELFGYVARRVPMLSHGRQHPYNKMEGTDFPLLRVAAGGAMATPVMAVAPTAVGPPRGNVIGVMEFQNLRQDAAYDWISKALRLAFNTELSKVQALRVYSPELIDRTAQARGTDPLYTARELGIGRLLTGAYYVSDDTLRIDARIVDATTGVNQASDSVEGHLDQFFDLQKQLVLSMLRRLPVQVSPEEGAAIQRETNTDVDAYRLLLEAEGVGVGGGAPRIERTEPKPATPHSSLDHLRRGLNGILAGTAYADEPTPGVDAEVREFLERYRAALASKNVDEVAALYVSFADRQRDALRGYFANADGLTVELGDVTITPNESGVAVSFTRRDRFVDAQSGRLVRLEVRLTKVLVREQSSWTIGGGQ